MQMDFHYYATYCAAFLAGYSHEDSLDIAYSAQFVDCCTRTLLSKLRAPLSAATTQLQLELMNARTDLLGLQDITRIWSSFHFLPGNLYAEVNHSNRLYKNKFRLICAPNGALVADTVKLSKGGSLQAAGIAMHVLADTWAHRYFAGTPSLVINNVNEYCREIREDNGMIVEVPVQFRHNPAGKDDPATGEYNGTVFQATEHSVMNLGHGRAGHLPDYSFMRYVYLPAWCDYQEILKDNPADYYYAFCQMVRALRYLRGTDERFEPDCCDADLSEKEEQEIRSILSKRQTDASADWKAFGESLSGEKIPAFDEERYTGEYIEAGKASNDDTFLGRFILAAMAQKSMVTNRIYSSGNMLAGFSVNFEGGAFRGIRDFKKLVQAADKTK